MGVVLFVTMDQKIDLDAVFAAIVLYAHASLTVMIVISVLYSIEFYYCFFTMCLRVI